MTHPAIPEAIGITALALYAAHRRRMRRGPGPLPTDIPILDPVKTKEGRFPFGLYLDGTEGAWDPWGMGEQHLAALGTTNSGKTVLAKHFIVSAREQMGWEVRVGDGGGGGDFVWVSDANLGLVTTRGAIPVMLAEVAKEVMARRARFHGIRLERPDPTGGPSRAMPPTSLRDFKPHERAEYGMTPILLVLDELPILLRNEDSRKKEISGPLGTIAAAGRAAGVHIVALMQRGDVSLFGSGDGGFIGNLLRARVLIGSTDSTAQNMAHGSTRAFEAMAEEAGYESSDLERALRPPGRALVSGVEGRPTDLVQLYRFDPITRVLPWAEWKRREAAALAAALAAESDPESALDPSSADPEPGPPDLSLVPSVSSGRDVYAHEDRERPPRPTGPAAPDGGPS